MPECNRLLRRLLFLEAQAPRRCRVVNRDFVFETPEKEQLRMLMRMYEVFSGNRVVSYCFMSNHIHLLLEIVPAAPEGLTDAELLRRLRAINSEAQVAEVAKELEEARKAVAEGRADESLVKAIHARFTYRMHDLSQFMKSFMQRYCARSAHATPSGRASSGAPFPAAAIAA